MSTGVPSSSSSPSSHLYDCIVVGGGLSGLSAAHHFHTHSVTDVLVLEARDRVGGRTHTKLVDGFPLDVGGAYVGPTQHRILRLLHALSIPTKRVYTSGKAVTWTSRGRFSHASFIPPVHPLALLDLNHAMRVTDRHEVRVSPSSPWLTDEVDGVSLDSLTMEEWIERTCDTHDARELYRGVVRALFCVEPCEVSALYWMLGLRSAGGRERTLDVDNGAQERKVVGGTEQISNRLRALIGHDRVLTSTPVASISSSSSHAPHLQVTTRDGTQYHARHVVVALSPSLYGSITFDPALPPQKAGPAARMYGGSIVKVLTRYATPWWRERGYSGELFDTAGHIVSGGYDDCQSDGDRHYYGLIGFVAGQTARDWARRSAADRMAAVTAQYREAFDCDDALRPLSYVELDWAQEEYSRGCYNAVAPPGVLTTMREQLTASAADGRLHFAAAELAVRWAGYLSGAVESGERAGHDVLRAMGKVQGEFVVDIEEGTDWECKAREVEKSWVEAVLPSVPQLRYALSGVAVVAVAFAAWRLRR